MTYKPIARQRPKKAEKQQSLLGNCLKRHDPYNRRTVEKYALCAVRVEL
jgi:hypothetical protein